MVKHEIKVEISNTEEIQNVIEKAYFDEGYMGKILGKKYYLLITEEDSVNYTIFNGLNNATVKITNDIIDGSMRFIVDESNGEVRLYPISTYCIKDEKYSFY
jgi:hypothetical protein